MNIYIKTKFVVHFQSVIRCLLCDNTRNDKLNFAVGMCFRFGMPMWELHLKDHVVSNYHLKCTNWMHSLWESISLINFQIYCGSNTYFIWMLYFNYKSRIFECDACTLHMDEHLFTQINRQNQIIFRMYTLCTLYTFMAKLKTRFEVMLDPNAQCLWDNLYQSFMNILPMGVFHFASHSHFSFQYFNFFLFRFVNCFWFVIRMSIRNTEEKEKWKQFVYFEVPLLTSHSANIHITDWNDQPSSNDLVIIRFALENALKSTIECFQIIIIDAGKQKPKLAQC